MPRDGVQHDAYKQRDAVLLQIGFCSYAAYLKSDLWSGIRERVLARDSEVCTCCMKKKARHVHHVAYDVETLCGDRLDKLTSLCAGCHRAIEFSGREWKQKTSLVESGRKLRRRRKRHVKRRLWDEDTGYRLLKIKVAALKRRMPDCQERRELLRELRRQTRLKEGEFLHDRQCAVATTAPGGNLSA